MTAPGDLVLVTGANGFVGSHLVDALLARGYRVRCMVRRSSNLAHIRDLPVEWAYADVSDAAQLRRACEGVDAVCHCAALTRAPSLETFMRVNADGTEALARAAGEANPDFKRFLFISSQAATGPARQPGEVTDESSPSRPVTWYGQSKLAAEQALWAMCRERARPLPLTIVRPSWVVGPRDRDTLSYFRLIDRHLNLQVGRDGRWASMIDARDLATLLVLALEAPQAGGQLYFGCGFQCSYEELARAIAAVMGKSTLRLAIPLALLALLGPISRVQGRLTGKTPLLNDQRLIDMHQRYWLCSGDKARRELGFVAQYDLERFVRETSHWYREHGWL
jgi:nucleoside-diphosphate-sugar epimerase